MHHPFNRGGVVRLLAIVVMAAVVLAGLTVTAAGQGLFPDVDADNPYFEDITCLAGQGIVGGFADGKYHTYASLERGQFAKMLVVALGAHTESDSWPGDPNAPTYPDAGPNDTSLFDYIEEAAADYFGVIKGYQNGSFGPNDEIQRYQMALMIVRAGGEALATPPADYDPGFTDAAAIAALGAEAESAIEAIAFNGIVSGFEDGSFKPYASTNRGQAAKVVCGLMDVAQPAMPVVPEDPPVVDHTNFISDYEGPQTCEACHPGVIEDVANSLHFTMEEEEVAGFQGMSGRY